MSVQQIKKPDNSNSLSDFTWLIWKAIKLWWDGWTGMLLLGIILGICWITIVLGPPATFGIFFGIRWWMDDKEIRWKQIFQAAKSHLLQSWLWFLVNLAMVFMVYANIVFYASLGSRFGDIMQIVALCVGAVWFLVQCLAIPYYVLMEKKSLPAAWKNGLFTILASPLFCGLIGLVLAGLIWLHQWIVPFFLAGPGLAALIASLAVDDRLIKFGLRSAEQSSPQEEITPS